MVPKTPSISKTIPITSPAIPRTIRKSPNVKAKPGADACVAAVRNVRWRMNCLASNHATNRACTENQITPIVGRTVSSPVGPVVRRNRKQSTKAKIKAISKSAVLNGSESRSLRVSNRIFIERRSSRSLSPARDATGRAGRQSCSYCVTQARSLDEPGSPPEPANQDCQHDQERQEEPVVVRGG